VISDINSREKNWIPVEDYKEKSGANDGKKINNLINLHKK